MKALAKRVDTLETARSGSGLSPAAKAWLGHKLTPAEQSALAAWVPEPVDTGSFSQELKTWLGID